MDKASASGAEDWEFESPRGFNLFCFLFCWGIQWPLYDDRILWMGSVRSTHRVRSRERHFSRAPSHRSLTVVFGLTATHR